MKFAWALVRDHAARRNARGFKGAAVEGLNRGCAVASAGVAPVWHPPAEPRKFERAGDRGHLAIRQAPKAVARAVMAFLNGH